MGKSGPVLYPFSLFTSLIFLLPGCAGGPSQDPFAGYYIGADKTMKITPTGSGKYHILIKGKSGREQAIEAESLEGKLVSELGGYSLDLDSGSTYSMGAAGQSESIRKTDSLHFVQWWRAAGDTLIGTPDEIPSP